MEYYNTSPLEKPPAVTDPAGKTQPVRAYTEFLKRIVFRPVLKPGEELDIPHGWTLELQPVESSPAEEHLKKLLTLYGVGKFSVRVHVTAMTADDTLTELGKLTTGNLELEVKEPPVAWGEVVGGLQAGLSFKSGEKRTYSHGEAVNLVIMVRNVGKEEILVRTINTLPLEEPPTVTDDAGKTYQIEALRSFKSRFLIQHVVAPGKEIELNKLSLKLRPAQESAEKHPATLYGAGKFQIHFPTLVRGTDPALNKIATGKLDLEVTDKPPAAPAKTTPDAEKKPPQEQGEKPKPVAFTIKNVTIDEVDAKAEVVTVRFGNKEKPTKLVNVPLDKGVNVVASHVRPGGGSHMQPVLGQVELLTGKVASMRLVQTADGLVVVSISSGND